MNNTTTHFLFRQIDSWFFRESRSMDGAGSTALESLFPPPNSTLLGALRTQIGNRYHANNGSDWKSFNETSELAEIIGYGNNYADLKAQGAWLYHTQEQQLYFPLPTIVVEKATTDDATENTPTAYDFFALPEDTVQCDLGNIRLPVLKTRGNNKCDKAIKNTDINAEEPNKGNTKRDKAIENAYISAEDLNKVLQGEAPQKIIDYTDIILTEPRLGIARDNKRRKTEDGKLYQTNHLRLKADWQLYLGLDGLDKDEHKDYIPTETVLRLGGEARMAELKPLVQAPELPDPPTVKNHNDYLVIYLLTPLPDYREQAQTNQPALPNPKFKYINTNHQTSWLGEINKIEINIITAITGKAERIGGWDIANRQSLPVRSFIPAGSCWVIEAGDKPQKTIDKLHGKFLTTGDDLALGYGQIIVGLVPKNTI